MLFRSDSTFGTVDASHMMVGGRGSVKGGVRIHTTPSQTKILVVIVKVNSMNFLPW